MATYRQIHTHIWDDPDFEELSPSAKLLFIYTFSNKHRNESGLYSLTIKKISFETGLSADEVDASLQELIDKDMLQYDWDNKVIWIRNALKYQTVSEKNIIACKKEISVINSILTVEFVKYYKEILCPIEPPSKGDTSPIVHPSKGANTNTNNNNNTNTKQKKDNKTKEKQVYAEFVSMAPKEYQTLVEQYGEEKTKRMVEVLDNYKGASGKRYRSDYRAILAWVIEKVEQEYKTKYISPRDRPLTDDEQQMADLISRIEGKA